MPRLPHKSPKTTTRGGTRGKSDAKHRGYDRNRAGEFSSGAGFPALFRVSKPERRSRSSEEELVGRIAAFVAVRVPEALKESFELLLVLGRYLHADEHASVIGAVVAIVE